MKSNTKSSFSLLSFFIPRKAVS